MINMNKTLLKNLLYTIYYMPSVDILFYQIKAFYKNYKNVPFQVVLHESVCCKILLIFTQE